MPQNYNILLPFSTIALLLILHVPITLATSTTKADNTLVLDVEGNPLEPGVPYYIRTELSKLGIGGGVVTASRPDRPRCPEFVAQLELGWYRESAVKFYPIDPSQKQIHISSNINIFFNTTSNLCPHQSAWHLTPDATNSNVYLSTGTNDGTTMGRSDQNRSSSSWLKIAESKVQEGFYQLEYCPNTGKNDIVCGVIDALPDYTEDLKVVWLGLSNDKNPNFFHLLSFIKA